MIKIREIIEVKANDDFTLECGMENGEIFKYDMSYLKDYEGGPMIQPLKDIRYFKKVYLEAGVLEWPNGFDIDGTAIALNGKLTQKVRITGSGAYFRLLSKKSFHHIALLKGDMKGTVLTRVHSECLTGDLFGPLRCDCGEQFATIP